jgi:predicted outer membrane protein
MEKTIKELRELIISADIKDIDNIIIDVQDIINQFASSGDIFENQYAGMIAEERSSLNYYLKFDIYKNHTERELEQFKETVNRLIGFVDAVMKMRELKGR